MIAEVSYSAVVCAKVYDENKCGLLHWAHSMDFWHAVGFIQALFPEVSYDKIAHDLAVEIKASWIGHVGNAEYSGMLDVRHGQLCLINYLADHEVKQ